LGVNLLGKYFSVAIEPPPYNTIYALLEKGYKEGREPGFWSAGRGAAFLRTGISDAKSLCKL